jgi:hypothetical protein
MSTETEFGTVTGQPGDATGKLGDATGQPGDTTQEQDPTRLRRAVRATTAKSRAAASWTGRRASGAARAHPVPAGAGLVAVAAAAFGALLLRRRAARASAARTRWVPGLRRR